MTHHTVSITRGRPIPGARYSHYYRAACTCGTRMVHATRTEAQAWASTHQLHRNQRPIITSDATP